MYKAIKVIMPEKPELVKRIEKLLSAMNSQSKEWDAVFFIDRVNHYYFTGTMQDGIFVLKKDGTYAYFVRKSLERAKAESPLSNIYPMKSYRDVLAVVGEGIHNIFIETETATYGIIERLKKYFDISEINSVEKIIFNLRAVKSEYELACIYEAGRQQEYLLNTVVPELLKVGMSESEFTAALLKEMVNVGYQGRSKFSMFQADIVAGQIAFGENSLYGTSFDGPDGMKGMCPASPVIGDRLRTLKKGDLVFVDIGYGYNGYHTDRTQLYMFGANPSEEMVRIHGRCLKLQKEAAGMLKPGKLPGEIYEELLSKQDEDFLRHFMGYGNGRVKFIGHGVGLHVDEYPVIAKGFNEPLSENMVVALEPKRALEGVGMLGSEDTYVVTKDGGRCITGGEKEIIVV